MKNSFSVPRARAAALNRLTREVENLYLDLIELPIEVRKPLDGAATQG